MRSGTATGIAEKAWGFPSVALPGLEFDRMITAYTCSLGPLIRLSAAPRLLELHAPTG